MNSPAHGAPAREQITGLILCGGAGSRLGGTDKGLAMFHGKALVDIAIEKLRPHVASIVISANRNLTEYQKRGYPVCRDRNVNEDDPHYDGPLAGILSGLIEIRTAWVVVVPCDCPLFPHDLVPQLMVKAQAFPKGVYVAHHPSFSLLPCSQRPHLESFLQHGKRKLGQWLDESGATPLAIGPEEAFKNLNRPEDFRPEPG